MNRYLGFLRSKKWIVVNLVLLLILVALSASLQLMNRERKLEIEMEDEIGWSYLTEPAADGSIYVVDSSHERLLHLGTDGRILQVIFPRNEDGTHLYIDGVSAAEDGSFYINADLSSLTVSWEGIFRYNAEGNLVSQLTAYDYSEYSYDKHRIVGLEAGEKGVSYIYLRENTVLFVSLEENGGVIESIECSYENAYSSIAWVCIRDRMLYLLNKEGRIDRICLDQPDETVCIYDILEDEDSSIVPFGMDVAEGKGIYLTDIRNRTIRFLPEGEKTSQVVFSETDAINISVSGGEEEEPTLYLSENGQVRIVGPEETIKLTKLKPNLEIIWYRLISIIFNIIFIILLICLIIQVGFRISRFHYSQLQLQILAIVLIISTVSFLVVNMMTSEFMSLYQEELCRDLEETAEVVANEMTEEMLEDLEKPGSFGKDAYNAILWYMEMACDSGISGYNEIYCDIIRLDDEGKGYACVYLDQSIGTYYPLDEEETEELAAVYETGEVQWNKGKEDISGDYLYVKVPIVGFDGIIGAVEVGTTTSDYQTRMDNLKEQIYAAIVILFFLIALAVSEMISMASGYERCRRLSREDSAAFPGHLLQLMVFVIFTAYNMTASFLPVYILKNMTPIKGISNEIAASFPIAVNLFMIGFMALFCASLVRKIGLVRLAMIGGLCSCIGNLLLFLCPIRGMILAALILDGSGVGLLANASYIMVTYISDEEQRTEGFSIYNRACITGINFGMMLGSILAVRYSQRFVFACVAICWGIVIAVTSLAAVKCRDFLGKGEAETSKKSESASSIGILEFLKDIRVTGFFILFQNPYIVFNSFAFYFVPIYCNEAGIGETGVSILLLIYSGIAILFGDALTDFTDKKLKKKAMYLAFCINILALLVYGETQNLYGLITALLMMGLSNAFGKPTQQSYYMELDSVKRYGEDRAIGIYNFMENIGESLGPMIFGELMVMTPLNLVLALFGGGVACAGGVHSLIQRAAGKGEQKRQKEEGKQEGKNS